MGTETSLQLPGRLIVQLIERQSGAGVPGIALELDLYGSRGGEHHFLSALSDSAGIVRIRREWVARAVEETRDFFVMDRLPSIPHCRPYVDIRVTTRQDIEGAIAAQRGFGPTPGMGVEPTVEELASARNGEYEPQAVRVTLDVPGQSVRRIRMVLARRASRGSEQAE